jgi:hypothetical protein
MQKKYRIKKNNCQPVSSKNPNKNKLLKAALEYADLGLSVIPIRSKSKKPILNSWRPYQKKRATEKQIRKWWEKWPSANIGIVTGKISGVVVLDFDFQNGGKESLEKFVEQSGGPPETPIARTGNGIHLYYAHPGVEIKNRAGIFPGLDVRGDGGYIVAPPSTHPNGKRYKWLKGFGGK